MDYNALAELLFPESTLTREDIEARYPERDLPEGAFVTRIGPSPTGFVHLGNLYNAVIAERIAHQSGGVFYLRIEDTDSKREVEGAVETLINAMAYFGVTFDEGATADGDNGKYGPYRQRQRKEIYHVFAKELVQRGLAYPCFLTAEEIDAIRGKLEMPRNNMDFVLLKSDGIPTYHFAHVIDDHFMRSTHVIRGEEWISSLPMHVELFNTLGWKQPIYCHTATLMKLENGSKRKLSKRKDPELALTYYQQEGICPEAVWEFLLTLLNSNFEEWRIANPEADFHDFPYTIEKMSISGALVDMDKLRDISKNVICRMSAQQVFDGWKNWCEEYNAEYADLIKKYPERTLAAINVGRGGAKPRKDIETWKQACDFMSFYYDETFKVSDPMPEECDDETRKLFFAKYLESYDHADDSSEWFAKVKVITEELGFAVKPKDYKKNPDQFKGSIVHITNMLRIALTGHANAPDIWEVSHVLGEDIVRARMDRFAK